MTLPATAPTSVVGMKDRFLECSTIAALGLSSASFFYPSADALVTLPAMVIERTAYRAKRETNGGYYVGGVLTSVLYVAAGTVDDGQLEEYADLICAQLTELMTDGIFILSVEAGRSGAPAPGMFPGSDTGQLEFGKLTRTIMFTVEWGDS